MKKPLSIVLYLVVSATIVLAQDSSPNTNLDAREQQIVAASKLPSHFKFSHDRGLAQIPPMGWNSYDVFGDSVTEDETLANATWMRDHLLPFGWDTIVIDFRWYDPHPTGDDRLLNPTRTGAALTADEWSRLLPAPDRFPSSVNASATDGLGFKPLADRLH